ncbi:unnamed protein product, partial [Ectocarpus sp. 8 AP-2014]
RWLGWGGGTLVSSSQSDRELVGYKFRRIGGETHPAYTCPSFLVPPRDPAEALTNREWGRSRPLPPFPSSLLACPSRETCTSWPRGERRLIDGNGGCCFCRVWFTR